MSLAVAARQETILLADDDDDHRLATVPIVLVTSGAMPAQACDEFNVGRLFKPYLPDELLAVVRARTNAIAAAAGAPTSPAPRR